MMFSFETIIHVYGVGNMVAACRISRARLDMADRDDYYDDDTMNVCWIRWVSFSNRKRIMLPTC